MATKERITFENQAGVQLAAVIEYPTGSPRAFALFAHCFTCGKDIVAATRISRSLTAHGIAVLRFDFTGIGSSEGDFANSDFSANTSDLLSAADYLRSQHRAPQLLIGHSLGGTAVLAAASQIPEAEALVTIGAPASPEHVLKQFSADLPEIEAQGSKKVTLAGRDFTISSQFVNDLRTHSLTESIRDLKKALLVFHAPFDNVVSISEAAAIFTAAKHPKSFISLDGADHLVSKVADAQYIADTITAWAGRYLTSSEDKEKREVPGGEVYVGEGNQRFLRDVVSDDHAWLADEPRRVGGDNLGPDPYEHLLAALGTCTSMTIRMYANRKKWPLEDIDVQLEHSREHAQDCEDCGEKPAQIDVLTRTIRFEGELDDSQRARLMAIADRCPVHRTLEGSLRIDTREWAEQEC